MKLKERREISSEMGMSSMTDIIFILLIFFMMVSTLVHPSALNLTLPSNAKAVNKPATTEHLDDIGITASGGFILNGVTNKPEQIKMFLERNKIKKKDYKVTVSPDTKAPVEKVVQILDMTQSLGITSILHADSE
ncbi:MAG: biopolymer transporter ExbD [Saprospiraceae bacterium]|nr:biopolymer transporter ExbD [Saprospiraceae bacterium]